MFAFPRWMLVACVAIVGCASSHSSDVDAAVAPDAAPTARDASVIDAAPIQVDVGLDATVARPCGGSTATTCAPDEFCRHAEQSWCGTEGSPDGVCQPRPTPPTSSGCRGSLDGVYVPPVVCGCDGNDYPGECRAWGAGTDVAHVGTCHPDPVSGSAARGCAAIGGPSWDFVVAAGEGTASCDTGNAPVLVSVFDDLVGVDFPRTFVIAYPTMHASALACVAPGACDGMLDGTVTIHSFEAGSTAVISYDLRSNREATGWAADHVLVSLWCGTTPPTCR
jgi:hypothetical protein